MCTNFKGSHAANYTKYIALLDYLERRNRPQTMEHSQTQQQQKAPLPPLTVFGILKYSKAAVGNKQRNSMHEQVIAREEVKGNSTSLRAVMTELKEINNIINVGRFLLRQLKTELLECKSHTDKLMVLLRYIDIFN